MVSILNDWTKFIMTSILLKLSNPAKLEKVILPLGTVLLGGIFLMLSSNFPNVEEEFF